MLINLTTHPIVIEEKGVTTAIPPSKKELRVTYVRRLSGEVDGISLYELVPDGLVLTQKTENGTAEVLGPLPEQKEDVYYIVSALAYMQAFPLHRSDLLCPDTDRAVKNERGHVSSVPGFVTYNLGDPSITRPAIDKGVAL